MERISGPETIGNRDPMVVTALVALLQFPGALAERVRCRAAFAYNWDSAEFTVAVAEYNVALSQPHPPGYFLYVMLGRLVNGLVRDPHVSLVWISLVCGSALVSALYLLGRAMFGMRVGVVSALLAMTSPQLWFHSCVVLSYALESFLVGCAVLCCWRARQRGGRWTDAVLIGAVMGLVGGVRPQTVPGLAGVVVCTFWNFQTQRAAKLLLAIGIMAVLSATGFVPMVKLSGGLPLYWEALTRNIGFNARKTLAGGGWRAVQANTIFTTATLSNGLMFGVPLVVWGLFHRTIRLSKESSRNWYFEHEPALWTLLIWIGPMMVLGAAVGFTDQPGHVQASLIGWLLVAGLAVAQVSSPHYSRKR
jgi:4-amino-4-deoxy-L-arabinose transferase-like glycosyltransferase